ncbi:hypothetical protein TNCT_527961 [Trichonephila clavata]|uniref:Uncharacterized protein n=1 Tax=Trichonephila clavata TaxID=2740835 RepID=A0A8X6HJA4_TRICU|nr:hypothetical protein TNCT_527961 [Trichonephila clavata]
MVFKTPHRKHPEQINKNAKNAISISYHVQTIFSVEDVQEQRKVISKKLPVGKSNTCDRPIEAVKSMDRLHTQPRHPLTHKQGNVAVFQVVALCGG